MVGTIEDDDHCDGRDPSTMDYYDRMLPEMPLLPITSLKTVEACRSLHVNGSDIFVCSYPKSGTTWTQNLVVRLLAANVGMKLPDDWHLSHSAPFYEVDRYWEATTAPADVSSPTLASSPMERVPARTPIQTPSLSSSSKGTGVVSSLDSILDGMSNWDGSTLSYRVFNTHLRPHQLPRTAKCIYIMRDPLDVLVSFYHHLVNMADEDGGYHGSPQEFGQNFVDGRILYGKWEDHMEAWLGQHKDDKEGNVTTTTSSSEVGCLLLHYEDMKNDLPYEATRLARFLGVPEDRIQKVLEEALPQCTFDAMKRERWRYTPQSVAWKLDPNTGRPYDDFVRSGTVGEGRTKVTKEFFTPALDAQWRQAMRIAKWRWQKAGVEDKIIERYLSAE